MRKGKTDRKLEDKTKPSNKQNMMGLDTLALGVFHECQIYKFNVILPKLRSQKSFILRHIKFEVKLTKGTPSSLPLVKKKMQGYINFELPHFFFNLLQLLRRSKVDSPPRKLLWILFSEGLSHCHLFLFIPGLC